MSVRRYDITAYRMPGRNTCCEAGWEAIEREDGDFVLHSDFQKRDELVRELVEALRAFQDAMRKGSDPRPDLLALVNALHMTDAVLAKAKAIDAEEGRS